MEKYNLKVTTAPIRYAKKDDNKYLAYNTNSFECIKLNEFTLAVWKEMVRQSSFTIPHIIDYVKQKENANQYDDTKLKEEILKLFDFLLEKEFLEECIYIEPNK